MELEASIKPHCTYNIDGIPLNSHTKVSVPDGIDNYCNISVTRTAQVTLVSSDIEMITLQTADAYTSLKDLLPTSNTPKTTSSSSILSPAKKQHSLPEMPINLKDPLLQHAAWAYLQPAMMPQDNQAHTRSFLHNLKHHCCGAFGCFKDVFLVFLNACRRGGPDDDDDDEEKEKEKYQDQENNAAASGCFCN